MEKYSFNGKHVLVTGASGGLGSALVRKLAEAGAQLVVSSRSMQALKELISTLPEPTRAVAVTADLSSPGGAEMLAQNPGLGKFVWDEFQNGSSNSLARIMVAVFAIGLIGFLLDRTMLILQRKVSWDKSATIR